MNTIPCYLNGSLFRSLPLAEVPVDMRQGHLQDGSTASVAAYHLSTTDPTGTQVDPQVATHIRAQSLDDKGLLICSKSVSLDHLNQIASGS
jgi:hypothetical protein